MDVNFSESFPEHLKEVVNVELSIFSATQDAIDKEKAERKQESLSFKEKFDQIKQELEDAIETDLAHLSAQLDNLRAIAARRRPPPIPEKTMPYFSHLRVVENEKVKDILLGYHSFISSYSPYPIVDWRNAPFARIFFKYSQGEEFEEEFPARMIEGKILMRHTLSFKEGMLCGIQGEFGRLFADNQGIWSYQSRESMHHFRGGERSAIRSKAFGLGIRSGGLSPAISGLLDENQFEVLTHHEDEPIFITGGAGSGKTTVATHRMAYLIYNNPKKFPPKHCMYLVPEKGIALLTENLLSSLQMNQVSVRYYPDWIMSHFPRIVKGSRKNINYDTDSKILAVKLSRAIGSALDVFVGDKFSQFFSDLAKKCPWLPPMNFQKPAGKPMVPAIYEALKSDFFRTHGKGSALLKNASKGLIRKLNNLPEMLFEFLGNEKYVKLLIEGSAKLGADGKPDIERAELDKLIANFQRYVSEQFKEREVYYSNEGEIKGIDDQAIEREEDFESDFYDFTDVVIMYLISQRLNGQVGTKDYKLRRYKHLVIDEVQDFSASDFRIIADIIGSPPSLTIAGDFLQNINVSGDYISNWQAISKYLQIPNINKFELEINYRTTKQIADFCKHILGDALNIKIESVREGPDVLFTKFENFTVSLLTIIEKLKEVQEAEPDASIAIVTKNAQHAARVYDGLKVLDNCRLTLEGMFSFGAGIDVTTVRCVKGLEFDYVVIPDCDRGHYKDITSDRNTLYLACSRAIHQLWVGWVGQSSELISEYV